MAVRGYVDVSQITAGQVGCLIIFVFSLALWSYAEVLHRWTKVNGADGDGKGRGETRELDKVKLVQIKHPHLSNDEEAVDRSSIHALPQTKEGDDAFDFWSVGSIRGKLFGDAGHTGSSATCDASTAHCIPDQRRSCPSPSSFLSSSFSRLRFFTTCSVVRCFLLDREALLRSRESLRRCVELGAIMAWLYFADRHLSASSGDQASGAALAVKHYSRDTFCFLFAALVAVAYLASRSCSQRESSNVSILSRDQTEEWKGWMQVLFLMYHYFAATEIYNVIRVFIAAYVWMTGYGNFLYYVKTGDFSLRRIGQTLWRLNFLVAVCCVTMRNSYMLYYICPMHTLYTLMVYATMATAPKLNASLKGQAIKIAACLVVTAVCWESRSVFDAIWRPLTFLVGYQDPRRRSLPVALASSKGMYPGGIDSSSSSSSISESILGSKAPANATIPTTSIATLTTPDKLHEWHFRSSLDRYIWIHGMACAALKPTLSDWLKRIDLNTSGWKKNVARGTSAAVALAAGGAWLYAIGTLPKGPYNKLHPFTSWIPITSWILLRNLTPGLRRTHLDMFSWLGRITLETYIIQFHTWLSTGGVPDAQPRGLLELLPVTKYPLLNFGLCSAVFVFLSRRLFVVTASLNVFTATPDPEKKNMQGQAAQRTS